MNPEKEKALATAARRNPFWACMAVFLVLSLEGGLRTSDLLKQRSQLAAARVTQAETAGQMSQVMAQMPELESRLQPFTLELLQLAQTNAAARQIVQEFNIQWTPGSTNETLPATKPNPSQNR
jgi:hypothetical protein